MKDDDNDDDDDKTRMRTSSHLTQGGGSFWAEICDSNCVYSMYSRIHSVTLIIISTYNIQKN